MTNSSALLREIADEIDENKPDTVVVVVFNKGHLAAYASGEQSSQADVALALGAAHQYILRSVTDGK